ncbi:MAG TPA: hypothetical protein VIC24_17065 [Gemmatimonadaceae bacterium]|jgi:hypothetical protein
MIPPLHFSRVRALVVLGALVLVAGACERIAVGPQIAGQLRSGRAYAERLIAHPPSQMLSGADSEHVVALGYLERQRLGLGGPFRLIDYALGDPRLAVASRDSVAWALLARTLDGNADHVNPIALDSLTDSVSLVSAPDGEQQYALIDRTIRDAHDPRAGELAVRLAYTLAAAEHRLRSDAPHIAAQAAALVRDRELAKRDVNDLLRAAWRDDADPLALLQAWRRERRFRVEQPLMERLPPDVELEAMRLTPGLQDELRKASGQPLKEIQFDSSASLLGLAAGQLERLALGHARPPETPVVVAMWTHRDDLLRQPGGESGAHTARMRFLYRSRGEEGFAAERSLVAQQAPGIAVARTTLAAAVALRAYAQETPWYPGDPAPTDAQLTDRYGLTAVTFDGSVPVAWRPYYRAMLGSALADLDRVLPSLDLTGLRIHFGENPLRGVALALHDPVHRIIYLPSATSAGTIAHEIAHDLDWQAAERRYAVRGDYATDRAVRDARGGQLAASLRGLTAASLTAVDPDDRDVLSMRPTEVFARSVDWFVAVSLAREGRMNGYLSSVQDDLFTGYVTVTPPDVTGEAGSALVSVLDDVAPPPRSTRDWYLTRYGPGRVLTPYDLVRRVLQVPLDTTGIDSSASLASLVAPVRGVRDSVIAIVDGGRCGNAAGDREQQLTAARRRLVELAARARASGIMRERGTALAAEDAWRWAMLAPYGTARAEVAGALLGGSIESALADRGSQIDLLMRDSEPAPGVLTCAIDSSEAAR